MKKQVFTFMKASFQRLSTYKFAMLSNYLNMIMNVFVFLLFAAMFGSRSLESIEFFGGDPISYIIIGSICWGYLWVVVVSISGAVTDEISTGTFEAIFLTRVSLYAMIIAHVIFGLLVTTIPMVLLLTIGTVFLNVTISGSYAFALLILSLSLMMATGLGLTLAGLNLAQKKIGAVIPTIQSVSLFFCNVYFPISVLPESVQPISRIIPFYYTMEGWRISLSPNPSFGYLWQCLVTLGSLGTTAMIVGLFVFELSLKKARKEGTLAYY